MFNDKISKMMKILLLIFFVCAFPAVSICRRQKRIALGSEVEPHSKPYQVHNVFMLKSGDVEICGGALISKSYVLTAAHCFIHLENIAQTVVIMGAHKLTDPDKEYQITENYIIHEGFKKRPDGYADNDVALIKLDAPVELTENIQLINLPKRSQVTESFNGVTATIAGWGRTEFQDTSDVLLEGISEIQEVMDICKMPNPFICAFATSGAPCIGDSGSPLVFNNTVIGVLSTGFCYIYSHYTRVTSFLDWIKEHSDAQIFD